MVVVAVVVGLVVLAVFAALHRYLWRRVVGDTLRPGSAARRAGTAVFWAGPLLLLATLVGGRTGMPFRLQQVLAWPGFLWLAFVLYLLFAVLVGEAVRPLLRRVLERRAGAAGAGAEEPAVHAESAESAEVAVAGADGAEVSEGATAVATLAVPGAGGPSRRLFVSRIVGTAAVAAAAGTVGAGAYGVLNGPSVKRITVPLAKLPRSAHGFRIAVVSDIHLGPALGRGFARRVVDTVNSTRPDLIAVVGDLVDGDVKDLGPAAEPLAGLEARHGAYFVTGNHEYFSGAAQWVQKVRELGLHPLENARTELPGFDLAGVNDVAGESEGQGPDFARALGDRDRGRASVLLAHQPVVIDQAVEYGVDLQLSGHTHGGQLWPGNYLAALANPTVAGLERYGDTQLYVTRGAGAWGPPVRVGAPSDITVVQLASRQT
ncbi:metallophosphoesterase [Streptomyces sp. NPDC058045]|uniref:metallophosphoesterase n=1 Tax=Streptomyces sp. NPDC058045 TaxID=3346311 RepID=UPI0036EF70A4